MYYFHINYKKHQNILTKRAGHTTISYTYQKSYIFSFTNTEIENYIKYYYLITI